MLALILFNFLPWKPNDLSAVGPIELELEKEREFDLTFIQLCGHKTKYH